MRRKDLGIVVVVVILSAGSVALLMSSMHCPQPTPTPGSTAPYEQHAPAQRRSISSAQYYDTGAREPKLLEPVALPDPGTLSDEPPIVFALGCQKCGTTTVYMALAEQEYEKNNSHVATCVVKEDAYFSWRFSETVLEYEPVGATVLRRAGWRAVREQYMNRLFWQESLARNTKLNGGREPVRFAVNPGYLVEWQAAVRIANTFTSPSDRQRLRFIVQLREPVSRALSHFKMKLRDVSNKLPISFGEWAAFELEKFVLPCMLRVRHPLQRLQCLLESQNLNMAFDVQPSAPLLTGLLQEVAPDKLHLAKLCATRDCISRAQRTVAKEILLGVIRNSLYSVGLRHWLQYFHSNHFLVLGTQDLNTREGWVEMVEHCMLPPKILPELVAISTQKHNSAGKVKGKGPNQLHDVEQGQELLHVFFDHFMLPDLRLALREMGITKLRESLSWIDAGKGRNW